MGKMHTRAKRKLGLTTSISYRKRKQGLVSKNGPKTFKSEESAHKWAADNKLDKGKYTLVPAKKRKKLKIVMK